jgi:hypothetical protein
MQKNIVATIFMGMIMGNAIANHDKNVYGYVEKVVLVDKNISLSAKLDTGAKSASLSATNIQEVKENGKTYLIFTLPTKFGNHQCKAEYAGRVSIKSRVGEWFSKDKSVSHSLKRPVVKMRVRLGEQERDIYFNLANRQRFNYPVLLGRDALIEFDAVIDPSQAFIKRKSVQYKVSEVKNHDH